MRIIEFATGLFTRYAPIAGDSIAELKQQLTISYNKVLNDMEAKKQKNDPIEKQLEESSELLDKLDPHTPEYEKESIRFETLQARLEYPTLFEKVVSILEKPFVRLGLMIAFIFVSKYIANKITAKKDDKEEQEDDFNPQNQAYHNPYGNYPPPPPYHQQPYYPQNGNWQNQPQRR